MSISEVLADCEQTARDAGIDPLARTLALARQRLGTPMRVAVAGQIKRGKSTLVNALLGEEVAPTARLEATFTVSEFHDALEHTVRVHFKDPNRPSLPVDPAEFTSFTMRDPAQAAILNGIRRVEYGLPIALLETFRLVDTPGLASVHGTDSDNATWVLGLDALAPDDQRRITEAMAGMGRTAQDLHTESAEELVRADAVVYLFDRALNTYDLDAVSAFLGPLGGNMNALKAFGVLSRCDETYWPPGPDQPGDPDPLTWDPLAVARRIVDGYLTRPENRRIFYSVLPVAGLVGVAARTLDDEAFGWLAELGTLEPRTLAAQLGDAGYFATTPRLAGVALPAEHRAALIRRLGAWGTLRAACYLRDGLGVEKVRDRLVVDSGVARLRETIRSHFGNRSTLIKLDHGTTDVTTAVSRVRLAAQRSGSAVPPAVDAIAGRIQDLRSREHGFAELGVLSELYRGRLEFGPDELREIARVTGEDGVGVAARLGAPDVTDLGELAAVAAARVDAWARRVQDPFLDEPGRAAARVVLRSYERLADRLRIARALLEGDEDLRAAVSS